MIKCLVALLLVSSFSFSATALAWGLERTPSRPHQRHISQSTSVHPWRQMREHKPGKYDDSDWHREYWEPCNSTFREYIVWGCDSN